jgi:hypothetical protein
VYLFDANVFIQAKNFHYSFEICPAFWDWLDSACSANLAFSVESVFNELNEGADELTEWAKKRRSNFFLDPDSNVLRSLQTVSQWASSGHYEAGAVGTFLQAADYFIVAHAHAYDWVVVTHEIASPSIKRIKIPNACAGVGVQCMTPFEMLRREKAKFILGA